MKQKNTNYLPTKPLNQSVKGDVVSSWESGIRSGGKSLNPSQANTTTSISDSYNRMGFGKIGGLGGRMGELELKKHL